MASGGLPTALALFFKEEQEELRLVKLVLLVATIFDGDTDR